MEQLRQLFPETFTEGKIDIKRLTATLGENVATGRESYELSWAGKADARAEIQKRTTATLRPDTANSVNWDATQNLYIEGENLEVLRTLQKAYFGKVKMIYIDPPYNTGNDSFVYPDDYSETLKEYQARTGQTDEAGFVNKQTLWKKNSKENGQFHSVWLSMMYPRLFLARNLLRDDGVIFVSIDDNEAADLKLLMDEIFGEENFIGKIVWKKKTNGNNMGLIPPVHDFIFAYAKNAKSIPEDNFGLPLSEEFISKNYSNPDGDERGLWTTMDLSANHEGPYYPIVNPKTKESFLPSRGRYWVFNETEALKRIKDGRIIFGKSGDARPVQKVFLNERKSKRLKIESWWDKHGLNEDGTAELTELFDMAKIFVHSKPSKTISFLVNAATQSNDLIFDFFSGSGTTAQAVLDLNEEDGGNRQFICVQMPEVLDESSEAYKVGYRTIADIGRARIAKVLEKIESKRLEGLAQGALTQGDMQKQALGFNAFKLAPSNFKEWRTDVDNEADLLAQLEYHVDSAKPDSEAGGMVYELLLKLALPITTPIESHKVGDDATAATAYMAKPDNGKHVAMFFEAPANHAGDVLTFILKAKPVKVLCLNKCFVDSQALTNFSLQLQDADIALEVL
ncbi:site-specific DNA-methyltransferase [Polynucleobacter sp. AM-25C3]|uniref:site-specific DNA-methyltransferase n=1 Tax=Polynucleobacter sp. AM-25C3 TaxID=1855569 RepID=UPI001C0CA98C|nr:site-specific DNA-methyltransferase [Polynucleobacter sp. AM-25C3]